MKATNSYIVLILLVTLISCMPKVDLQEPKLTDASVDAIRVLENLSIPNNFNFETERIVTLLINDATPYVKYKIFAYAHKYETEAENISESLNNLLFTGKPYDGSINQILSLPHIYDKVYILRKDGLEYSSKIINVLNQKINLSISSSNKSNETYKTNNNSCASCINNLFINGNFEDGPSLPNQKNHQTNEHGVDGWSTSATDHKIELWKSETNGVPSQNGSYFAEINANKNGALYQRICTNPGAEISWSAWHRGLHGTDIALVKIGQDLTTATIETIMTSGNIAWTHYSGTYTVPAGQDDTYFIFETVSSANNDANVGNFIDHIVITETVAGNCTDTNSRMFYPTKSTNATLVFEDQWPYTADYDFNDLVINYTIVTTLNTENKVTQINYNYKVESTGGSYVNGFGIKLEGVLPAAIKSVTGTNLTERIINNSANGTEQSQPNAVIIFFDNSHTNVGIDNTISILFSSPIKSTELNTAPFNPFLIINKDRLKEVHLPKKSTTYYPTTTTIKMSPSVKDRNGNFKTITGLPWAINITGEFKAPKEKIIITDAYNHFANWATSGGRYYLNWYQDLPGNINISKLKD